MMDNLLPTNQDLQRLLSENPLAMEQLKRIILERHLAELRAEFEQMKNGKEAATGKVPGKAE